MMEMVSYSILVLFNIFEWHIINFKCKIIPNISIVFKFYVNAKQGVGCDFYAYPLSIFGMLGFLRLFKYF